MYNDGRPVRTQLPLEEDITHQQGGQRTQAVHVTSHRWSSNSARRPLPTGASSFCGPARSATVAGSWRIVRDKVGIPYRLHDLRHFYASGLIRAGCDVVTVQRALGHSSAAITLTTYSHLWPDAHDRTRKAAGELLQQSIGAAADDLRTEG
jgi:integrase